MDRPRYDETGTFLVLCVETSWYVSSLMSDIVDSVVCDFVLAAYKKGKSRFLQMEAR